MSTQKAITGNVQKKDSSTILGAGNVASTKFNSLSFVTNLAHKTKRDTLPVEQSTQMGITKAVSAGKFANMEEGEYVGMIIGDRIASTNNTTLRSGAGDMNRGLLVNKFQQYRQLDITSWNYETGVATKGGAAGRQIPTSGINGQTGHLADKATGTDAVPFTLRYAGGTPTPVMASGQARNG